MEIKMTNPFEFILGNINKKLKPFKFETQTVYCLSDESSDSSLKISMQFTENFRNRGYKFVYLSEEHNHDIEDLENICKYFFPLYKSSYDNMLVENLKNNQINFVDLIQQFLGIEERAKTVFIFAYSENLYVIQLKDIKNDNVVNVVNEIINYLPKINFDTDVLFSPFGYDPQKDEDYFELDDETKNYVNDIFEKFDHYNKSGKFLAILPFLEKQIKIAKSTPDTELSSLYIDKNYNIFLKDYGKEIKMSHLTKSLYFLFLINVEIDLAKIHLLHNNLFIIYKHISNQENIDKMQMSISQLLRNEANELYVHFSRIKSAFCRVVDQNIAKNYYIKGAKSQPKSISLDRELTNIRDLQSVWFPKRIIFTPDELKYFDEILGKPL